MANSPQILPCDINYLLSSPGFVKQVALWNPWGKIGYVVIVGLYADYNLELSSFFFFGASWWLFIEYSNNSNGAYGVKGCVGNK